MEDGQSVVFNMGFSKMNIQLTMRIT